MSQFEDETDRSAVIELLVASRIGHLRLGGPNDSLLIVLKRPPHLWT